MYEMDTEMRTVIEERF